MDPKPFDALARRVAAMHVDDPVDDGEYLGPVVDMPDVGLVGPVQAHRDPVEVVADGSSWGCRVVLGPATYLRRPVGSCETGDEVQSHVDARRHPRGGDDVPVIDVPDVGSHLDARVDLGEKVEHCPVRRGGPTGEHSGSGVDEGPGAHTRQYWYLLSLAADSVQVGAVVEHAAGSLPAGVDHHLELRAVGEGVLGADHGPPWHS